MRLVAWLLGRKAGATAVGQTSITSSPPEHWEDKDSWDRYFNAELAAGHTSTYPDFIVLRFLSLAHEKGGRIWFSGCGLDPYPSTYAERGCNVLATDLSSVAVRYQRRLGATLAKNNKPPHVQGTWAVAEHDFTQGQPDGEFDVVINNRAFQGLSDRAMHAAARHFYAALRPGGTCIIDTMNVQGHRRDLIEDSLIAAGFYLPFQKSARWYRRQLDSTGIVYGMVMGRPRIPGGSQYPPEQFAELAERDQQILDSLRSEYERKIEDETAEVKAIVDDPATIVAYVVYATG